MTYMPQLGDMVDYLHFHAIIVHITQQGCIICPIEKNPTLHHRADVSVYLSEIQPYLTDDCVIHAIGHKVCMNQIKFVTKVESSSLMERLIKAYQKEYKTYQDECAWQKEHPYYWQGYAS